MQPSRLVSSKATSRRSEAAKLRREGEGEETVEVFGVFFCLFFFWGGIEVVYVVGVVIGFC